MGALSTVDFDNPSTTIIKPVSLAHVVLRTSNLQPQRDFYLQFLGAHVQYENEQLCFLTYDEEHHRIALVQIPGTASKAQTTCGLEHIAFTYASLAELLLSYRQKRAAGIEPVWCVNHGPTTSMYYRDADGNVLENQVDNFDTVDQANRFMMSSEFAENPFGVDFVPDELIERIKRGESEESLKKRPNIGPRDFSTVPFKWWLFWCSGW